MSEYITVVVEYKDGEEQPSFHADMELLGGKIARVAFEDSLLKLEDAETQLEECNC